MAGASGPVVLKTALFMARFTGLSQVYCTCFSYLDYFASRQIFFDRGVRIIKVPLHVHYLIDTLCSWHIFPSNGNKGTVPAYSHAYMHFYTITTKLMLNLSFQN